MPVLPSRQGAGLLAAAFVLGFLAARLSSPASTPAPAGVSLAAVPAGPGLDTRVRMSAPRVPKEPTTAAGGQPHAAAGDDVSGPTPLLPLITQQLLPVSDLSATFTAYQETIAAHAVNGTLLLSTARIRPGQTYAVWALAANWQAGLERAFPPPFHTRRLLIGVDEYTCKRITEAGVKGCVVDWSSWWPGAASPAADVNLKWLWAQIALSLGYRVLFSDLDVAFTGAGGQGAVLEYLTSARRAVPGGPSGVAPDLQIMSDVWTCTQATVDTSTATSRPWKGHTVGDWLANDAIMPCTIDTFYGFQSLCLSTGFWFALPTAPVLSLLSLVVHKLAVTPEVNDYSTWEQKHLNALVLSFVASPSPPISVVALDPRVIGNKLMADCLSSKYPEVLDRQADEVGFPRLASHYGGLVGTEKYAAINAEGYWYLPAPLA